MKQKLTPRRYQFHDVRDAIESSVRWAVHRAYKHRDVMEPPEEVIEQIASLAADEAMNDLCEMIEFNEQDSLYS